MSEPLPSRPPTGRIAFASIEALTLAGTMQPGAMLEAAMVAGTRIERYKRIWRMGPWRHEGEAIVGRIGFESVGVNELWNDGLQDFAEETRHLGLTSPFAVDPVSLRVAFQLRGRDIQAKSFVGALEALLNKASPADSWRVHRELRQVGFDRWSTEMVERVRVVRATLMRPNPHYGDRTRVRDIVQGTNARMAELAVRADPDDPQGIDVNAPLIREAIDHAARHYGILTAIGEKDGEEIQWSSAGEVTAQVRNALTDPTTRDVSSNALRHELGDPTAEQEVLADAKSAFNQTDRDDEINLVVSDEDED